MKEEFIPDGNVGFNTASPEHTLVIKCTCDGSEFYMEGNKEWKVNMRGDWDFEHECGKKFTLPEDIRDTSKWTTDNVGGGDPAPKTRLNVQTGEREHIEEI